MSDALAELFDLVNQRAYREGDFTLASGKRSPYYFNTKPVLLDPRGSRLFAGWIIDQMERLPEPPVAVGGLELGAVPIACAVMALSPRPLRAFIVRKGAKGHGTRQAIEGELCEGDRVAVVEDVVTTGESTMAAIRAVEAAGCGVVGVYCLVDREEGHIEALAAYADRLHPVFTLGSFLARRSRTR